MKGNPTAGILLLLLASFLIVLGVTDKGKKILRILFGTDTETANPDDLPKGKELPAQVFPGENGYKLPDGGQVAVNYPGANVGEKPAKVVRL